LSDENSSHTLLSEKPTNPVIYIISLKFSRCFLKKNLFDITFYLKETNHKNTDHIKREIERKMKNFCPLPSNQSALSKILKTLPYKVFIVKEFQEPFFPTPKPHKP
jgi:hypothetical protein